MPSYEGRRNTETTYDYLRKYARSDDTWQPWTSPDTVDLACQTVDAICNGESFSVLQLESVVSLVAHPESLYILDDSRLVDICILWLVQLQKEDPTYPFGHEEGYLLFRLVVLAIGIRIIRRVSERKYDIFIKKLLKNQDAEDLSIALMNHVAKTAVNQICQTPASAHRFLGWSSDEFEDSLISEQTASTLLDILWTCREGFFKAWAESYAPSVAGILCIIWRRVEMSSTSRRRGMFCDILWRYNVVAGTDQWALFELQGSAIHYTEDWRQIPARANLEDARKIIQVYTERLTSTSALYPVPTLAIVGQMVAFAIPFTRLTRGTEDLFVPALRATLEYFWLTVAGKTPYTKFILLTVDVATSVLPAFIMLDHLHKYSPNHVHEFVTTCADLGMIEALAKGLVLMEADQDLAEEEKSETMFPACTNFGIVLGMVRPVTFSLSKFAPAFPDWYKTLRYMRARDSMFETEIRCERWYKRAETAWGQLGKRLEYDRKVRGAEVMSSGCAYARCPDPASAKGVRFECPCDQDVVYCGHRCQKA
ncbi:hypothetical protein FRC12_023902 [Ceratobasidium sp. 428]|nr:hypothetical protein FRC12_023902 [Ceratobasidium sp. 428]